MYNFFFISTTTATLSSTCCKRASVCRTQSLRLWWPRSTSLRRRGDSTDSLRVSVSVTYFPAHVLIAHVLALSTYLRLTYLLLLNKLSCSRSSAQRWRSSANDWLNDAAFVRAEEAAVGYQRCRSAWTPLTPHPSLVEKIPGCSVLFASTKPSLFHTFFFLLFISPNQHNTSNHYENQKQLHTHKRNETNVRCQHVINPPTYLCFSFIHIFSCPCAFRLLAIFYSWMHLMLALRCNVKYFGISSW